MKVSSEGRDKSLIFVIFLAIIFLFSFFLKEIMVPFIKMEIANDTSGASRLLAEKGVLGMASVVLIEALQMVVIFVPAEFIQISSGLSYPFPIALLLCDLGVGLGATIIFVLVRLFNFNNKAYERNKKNIERISANVSNRNTTFLIYLLFFMPLIPFGAICYYGSGTRLSYKKYICTVVTGVIPSIVVSNLMGAAGAAFISNELPLWILITIIVALAALLFALIAFFIKKYMLKGTEGTPDSPVYAFTVFLARTWQGKPRKLRIDEELMKDVEAPYVVLSNHESFADFNYISRLSHPRNPSYLVNEFYCTRPILKRLAKGGGFIPKKLFTKEFRPAMDILRTVRKGFPVVIFPEGRLSPDGKSNSMADSAAFYKKLHADLVLVRINGAYYAKPKWRKKRFNSKVELTVKKVIKSQELEGMSSDELDKIIRETLYNNASEHVIDTYKQKNKAKGLENILYRCADCGELYTTKGVGNAFACTACGTGRSIGVDYRFSSTNAKKKIESIDQYYNAIIDLEEKELDKFELRTKVKTKIFGENGGPVRKENGECFMNSKEFGYRTESNGFTIDMKDLPALAFSSNEEFELYHNNELHYFYPVENRRQCARWALLVDLMAKKRGDI